MCETSKEFLASICERLGLIKSQEPSDVYTDGVFVETPTSISVGFGTGYTREQVEMTFDNDGKIVSDEKFV
jgi:hypothetical protein